MAGHKVSEMASVCDDRLISLIASGYNMEILPYAWLSLISGLTDIEFNLQDTIEEQKHQVPGYTADSAIRILDEVKNTHSKYWKCFT